MQESAQLTVCNGRAYSIYCKQSQFTVCILNLLHVTQSTINLLYAMSVYSIYCIQWYCHVCKSLSNWLYAMTEPTQFTVCNLNLLFAFSICCMQSQFTACNTECTQFTICNDSSADFWVFLPGAKENFKGKTAAGSVWDEHGGLLVCFIWLWRCCICRRKELWFMDIRDSCFSYGGVMSHMNGGVMSRM